MTDEQQSLWNRALAQIAELDKVLQVFVDLFTDDVFGTLKAIPKEVASLFTPMFDFSTEDWANSLIDDLGLDPENAATLKSFVTDLPVLNIVNALLVKIMWFGKELAFINDLISTTSRYELYKENRPIYTDGQSLLSLLHRIKPEGGSYEDVIRERFAYGGIKDEDIDLILKTQRAIPQLADLAELYKRGSLDEFGIFAHLKQLGYNDEDAGKMYPLMFQYPDLGMLGELKRRNLISDNEFANRLTQLGYEQPITQALSSTIWRPLDVDALKVLYWRGFATWEQAKNILRMHGYDENTANGIKLLWEPSGPTTGEIPPFQDVIQMAVRDVFDQEAVDRYGLMQNYPKEVDQYANILGYGEYWSKKYWASHWQMPGFATARQMLFLSDKFNLDDMERTLRYADFPPALVPAMIDAAYQPLTRVDVRRMYSVGVMGKGEVKEAYQKLGYNDLNAQRMTDFTVASQTEEYRASSKAGILKALEEYIITEQEARNYLQQVGYESEESNIAVGGVLVDRTLKEEQQIIDDLEYQYIYGLLTEQQILDRLGGLEYSPERVNSVMVRFHSARLHHTRRPTKADLARFVKKEIITANRYFAELIKMGYSIEHAEWYSQDLLES